jgi:aspartate-semialdehyde dehydrogenase
MRIAIVGATGLVGSTMLEVLAATDIPVSELIPVASEASEGKEILFRGQALKVVSAEEALRVKPQAALFSAGSGLSISLAPRFAEVGCRVIDNSSAWRMNAGIPLIVPEVNGFELLEDHRIIANPNCSTIQLVMALYPLQQAFGIRRVVVSTYQAVTGTGMKAVNQLMAERACTEHERVYPYPIDLNVIPQCDTFSDDGYTKEELKVVNETRKILSLPDLRITATAVRVPVVGGHSESVNVELNHSFTMDEVVEVLRKMPGIVVMGGLDQQPYPMPMISKGQDAVFVGRIRRDFSAENTLNLWVVADNLRKGAATNAVQILEFLRRKSWL